MQFSLCLALHRVKIPLSFQKSPKYPPRPLSLTTISSKKIHSLSRLSANPCFLWRGDVKRGMPKNFIELREGHSEDLKNALSDFKQNTLFEFSL